MALCQPLSSKGWSVSSDNPGRINIFTTFMVYGMPRKKSIMALALLCISAMLLYTSSLSWCETKLQPFSNAQPSNLKELYPDWWGQQPLLEQLVECKGSPKCVSCHADNSKMDPSHAVSCDKCHSGSVTSEDKAEAHEGLISDPGALNIVDRTCGKCHPEVAQKVKTSPMALAPRMINQTLFAFGHKECSKPFYATAQSNNLQELPNPASYFNQHFEALMRNDSQPDNRDGSQSELLRNLGADLLRRSCLRCHLNTRGSNRPGESRGQGCSACHVAYSNSSSGKPVYHGIVRNVGVTACLKCHNSNHVGADFVGLFEKDSNRGFRSPVVSGGQAPTIYGSEQHRLSADVHFKASMSCIDCHTLDEIHGAGKPMESLKKNVKISCRGCHVTGDHPGLLRDNQGNTILLGQKERKVPKWNTQIAPHRIETHMNNLACSSCHAAWSFQDYGLHLMLDERNEYWKWSINSSQNDPQVQDLIRRYTGDFAQLIPPRDGRLPNIPEEKWEPPVSFDWLSGMSRKGIWYRGWTLRRWSNPPLGLDSQGLISVLRPMYQYVVSYVDHDDRAVMDSKVPVTPGGYPALIVNPYTPHTTAKMGRSCHDCHGSYKAAGLGETLKGIEIPSTYPLISPESQIPEKNIRWDAFYDSHGRVTQFSVYPPPAGPLSQKTIDRLLNPSARQKAEWSKFLLQ